MLGKSGIADQPTDRLQGLGRHRFLGDVIGGADEGQVGDHQHGGEQHQQGGQKLLTDRQVFEALAQWHGAGHRNEERAG